jgi:hypothetical protein
MIFRRGAFSPLQVWSPSPVIDHPEIHMRWGNSAEKRRWMGALAMLLQVIEDGDILKTDREREDYKLVRTRLKQEFEYERLTWPLD